MKKNQRKKKKKKKERKKKKRRKKRGHHLHFRHNLSVLVGEEQQDRVCSRVRTVVSEVKGHPKLLSRPHGPACIKARVLEVRVAQAMAKFPLEVGSLRNLVPVLRDHSRRLGVGYGEFSTAKDKRKKKNSENTEQQNKKEKMTRT